MVREMLTSQSTTARLALGLSLLLAAAPGRKLAAESQLDLPQTGEPVAPSNNEALLGPIDEPRIPGARRPGTEPEEPLGPSTIKPVVYDIRRRQERVIDRAYNDGQVGEPRVSPAQDPRCNGYLAPVEAAAGGGGVVFDADGRTEVGNTTVYPYSAIGKIYAWFHDPSNDPATSSPQQEVTNADCVGTGAMIGSCHVITAGHVIYNWDPTCGSLGWAQKVIFVPGLYTDGSGVVRWPFGSQYATLLTSFEGWTQDEDEEHDMGLMVLDEPIGDTTGWFGYSTGDSDEEIRNISGYPGDRNSGLDQFVMADDIKCENTYNLKYKIDTAGGQSGAPVWRLENSNRYVHGVHAHGGVPFACGFETENRGVRITSGKFDVIQDWKADNDCPENGSDLDDDGDDSFDIGDLELVPHKLTDICLRVRNIATRPVQRTFKVVFVLSLDRVLTREDFVLGTSEVEGLHCFEARMVKIAGRVPLDTPPGKYHVGWVIDPTNDVPEFNEENNMGLSDTPVQVRRPRQDRFRRGEVNEDSQFNIADPVNLLGFLFLGGKKPGCVRAADANDDGKIDISDVTTSLAALFLGGVELRAPGPFACGLDEDDDTLECESYLPCR